MNKTFVYGSMMLLLAPVLSQAQDEVIRNVTQERLAKFLQGEKIEFKHSAVPKEDVNVFTFMRGKFEVHLTSFAGKDLMLDCSFKPLPLEGVNRWNLDAKFSRASLQKDAKGEPFTVLEYNLDLSGGVTVDALRSYLAHFDQELSNYNIYLAGPPDNKLYSVLPDDKVEQILKNLNLAAQKKSSGGSTLFEFELSKHPVRLQSYGGKDLRLAAKFPSIRLEDVNNYNLNRKFIRAVNYKKDDAEITVLEINLDCEPGVTEGMVRHFILSFGEDIRHFGDYVQEKHAKK
jgi:hypothetical protein